LRECLRGSQPLGKTDRFSFLLCVPNAPLAGAYAASLPLIRPGHHDVVRNLDLISVQTAVTITVHLAERFA
jgi:hypothetical protein